METAAALLIPMFLGVLLIRLMFIPMGWLWRVFLHSLSGFFCLWLLNTVSAYTGVFFPINAITISVAGFLGIPGIGLLTLLEILF